MKKSFCLNLCEIYNSINPDNEYLEKVRDESGYNNFKRLYLGSSFCSQYFIHTSDKKIQEYVLFCKENNYPVTLTLPVFSQKDLIHGKKRLEKILSQFGNIVDEITVNDFGMLEYLNNQGYSLNVGRLMVKDYRDKRYFKYFEQSKKPKIFNSIFMEFIKQYSIKGIEMDLNSHIIDMCFCPSNYLVGFHYPYCYQTTGNICEISSINKPTDKKFRPNPSCNMECGDNIIVYNSEDAGYYIKSGRTVYFNNSECLIKNCENARFIYFPLQMRLN